jgi:AcrR family transcriptional regulator
VPARRNGVPIDEDGRREQLLAIGMRLFSERPFDAISIDEIAQQAGMAKGLLYYYFPSKRHFYVEIVRSSADELRRLTETDASLPPLERLRSGLDAYLDYVEEHTQGYVTLLRGGIGSDDEVRRIIDGARDAIIERALAGLPIAGPASPALRLAVRGWVGFVEGAALDWLDRRQVPRSTLRDLLAASFMASVGAAGQVDPTAGLAR